MAFQKKTTSVSSKRDLPFLNEYLESLTEKEVKKLNGSLHPVQSIVFPKSGKGIVLNCENFATFFWSKSEPHSVISSFLINFDVEGSLLVQIDLKTKSLCELGCDDELPCEVREVNENRYEIIHFPKSTDTIPEQK